MGRISDIAVPEIVYSYSYDEIPPARLSINHCHDTFEILYIVSGKGRYIVEGSSVEIKPSSIMIVKPFEYHCVMLEPGVPYERYVINFTRAALIDEAYEILCSSLIDDTSGLKFYSTRGVPHNIISIFERIENSRSIPESEQGIYIKMLLSELIVLLSVSGSESISRNEGELGAKVIRYLNENIDKDVSLDRLAKRFFVSKYYLCRAFKKHNGISVHGYINQKRVMHAKQLIENGETASGAAYKVGFGDYSAFYRAYVKIVGKSPTAD